MSNRLENLQKRALRFVHSDFDSNYKSLLEKSKLDSLYLAREKKILIQVYKIIHRDCPPFLFDMFELKQTTRATRGKLTVHLPRRRTTKYGINSFMYTGAKLWNSLRNETRQAKTASEFKSSLLTWNNNICICNKCKHLKE